MPRRNNEADGACVDVAEHVSADFLVARTHVAAGPASDTAQGIPCERIVAHRHATVVEQNEMELLRTVHADLGLELDVGRPGRPGDELGVRRDLLARPASREELHYCDSVVDRRDDL